MEISWAEPPFPPRPSGPLGEIEDVWGQSYPAVDSTGVPRGKVIICGPWPRPRFQDEESESKKSRESSDPTRESGRTADMTAFQIPNFASFPLMDLLSSLALSPFDLNRESGKSKTDSGTFSAARRERSRTLETPVTDSKIESTPQNDPRTDEELLVAYRTGETAAFAMLVERYRNDLIQFLQRFLGSRAAADDVFQDAFLQIHLSAESFDASRRFKPWLYTIAANKARDFHRKRRRRSAVSLSAPVGSADGRETTLVDLLDGDDQAIDTNLLDEERQRLVKQVVDDLPAHYREILLLSYFQKLSYNQISDTLQIPLGTVKSRLHSAVAHFADSWQDASTRHQRRRGEDENAA